MSEYRQIGSLEIRFFQSGPQNRWVFAGSINPGGYATVDDAAVEAAAQIEGHLRGRLSAQLGRLPKQRDHASYWRQHIEPLASKGW